MFSVVFMSTSIESPIVVLDSGLGGLTVVRALRQALPAEEIIYLGDTARLPYGTKSPATVTTFIRQILCYLRPCNPKHVVIACNTASALALSAMRSHFPDLTLSGVIEPGSRAAVQAAGSRTFPVIGVIATEATAKSRAYETAIFRRRHRASIVTRPTPLLVPMIEEGRGCDDPVVKLALQGYLGPLAAKGIDVLVLGCTHYPILRQLIEKMMGPQVAVIDSAEQCAQDVARRLRDRRLLRPATGRSAGVLRCLVTDDPERFAVLGSRFIGMPLAIPEWVATEELEQAAANNRQAIRVPA